MQTFNGTGTRLYGQREPAADGSYVATKWVVLFFLPVLPLASYRVWRGDTSFRLLGASTSYHWQPVPLQWRQVLNWYLATLLLGPLVAVALGGILLEAGWHALRH